MDLDAMRANRVVEQFVAFLANHKTPRFPDQSLLNAVMAGHVKLVDRMWNSLFPQTCPRDFQSGLVLHYINATPWLDRSARVTHDNRIYLWHDFRDLVLARPSGSSIRDFFSGRVVTKKRLCARLLSNRLTAYLALRLFNAAANGSLPLNMIDNVRSLSDARRREIVGKWRDDLYARGYAE
jgi:lipopolysaccharide biosynthesis glycosyltransferase